MIPCLAFSVQNNGKLMNKICPFPYDLDYPNKIERGDIYVYEYHTVRDHMERGIVLKELDKIMKSKKEEHSDLIEFVTEIGKPEFKEKLENQIEKIRNNCNIGKNSLNRAPLKRSKADLIHLLYNYDSSVFTSVVQLCDYLPSNNFVAQMGTMVYHSTLEDNQNPNDKTYVIGQDQDRLQENSTNESKEISSALVIHSTSEEDLCSDENLPPTVDPLIMPVPQTVAYQETQFEEESRSGPEKIHNSQLEEIPLEQTIVQNISTDQIVSDKPKIPTKIPNEQNNSKDVAVTNSQLSELLYQNLGPNPFKNDKNDKKLESKNNNDQKISQKPSETDPEILKYKEMFEQSCTDQTETNKLLDQTQLSDASIQRMRNAANLPQNNNTLNLIDLTDETSLNNKDNEKSKVGFDSLQNQIKYISTEDQSSSLKKPKFGDKLKNRTPKNPPKVPTSIVKKSKTKPKLSNWVKSEINNDPFSFNPNANSTPHPKQEPASLKVEDSRILSNNYELTNGDEINPGKCLHGCETQAQCKECIANLIKFANDHHQNWVSKEPIKTENTAQTSKTKEVPINTVSKNRKTTSRNAKSRNHKSSSSSTEISEDEKPRRSRNKTGKNKKRKPSSEESSNSDDSLDDFESSRYSNISKNSEKLRGIKFRNTLKYPKLTREAALDPNKYFDRFITTLQINIDGGHVEECPMDCVSHILAEQMLDSFKAQEEIFSNLAETATTLKDVRSAFRKALAESVILREKRFEDIMEKPKDITWKSFASNLFQIFKNAFPSEKDPLNSKLLILKFKSLINKDLRKSYELSKVSGKNNDRNLFEIAEILDKIASFSVLETDEKNVFSIQKEVTFCPKEKTEKNIIKNTNESKNSYPRQRFNHSSEDSLRNNRTVQSNSNYQNLRNVHPQNQGRYNGPRFPYTNGNRSAESQNNRFQHSRNFQSPQDFHSNQRYSHQNSQNSQNSRNFRNFNPQNAYSGPRSNTRYHNNAYNYRNAYYNRNDEYTRASSNNSYNNYDQPTQTYPRKFNDFNNPNRYNQVPGRDGRINHKYRY